MSCLCENIPTLDFANRPVLRVILWYYDTAALQCIALWYYDTVALRSVWSRLKPVWLSLVRAETTRFIFVSPLSDWILATSLTTSLHVSTSLQPQSLTTGKTPRLAPNFPKKGLLWKRDLFKTSVISISVKTQFSEVIKMQVSAWVRSMKNPLVMLRRWRSWQGKKIESLLSVGRKARGGATSRDHEMLEQEAGGEVGESEQITWWAKKCAKDRHP